MIDGRRDFNLTINFIYFPGMYSMIIIGAMDRATFLDLIAPQLKELEDTMKVCHCYKCIENNS